MSTAGGQARQILAEALASVGYSQNHVEFDWPYLDHGALSGGRSTSSPPRLDLASFHDERRHDWQTSAVVADLACASVGNAQSGSNRVRQLFDATAAPVVVLSNGSEADLWLRCWESPRLIGGISLTPEHLSAAFQQNRNDVERQALARLRGGQQFLFDRVYDARRDQLAQFLHIGLERAVRQLRHDLKGESAVVKAKCEESLSHVAMALLAARIFEDKDFFGPNRPQSTEARQLLADAESESNGFFRHVIEDDLAALDSRLGNDLVDGLLPNIMAHLTGPACFSMITPDMLGDLYERALVANGRRGGSVNLKGIHYTPLSVAKHILRRIPIEELPPSQRYIADLACGSGSFLLAATSRLRDAFDANEADADDTVFEHLSRHIIGNDQDDIALLVAQLRYLLTHWVEEGTATEVPTPRRLNRDGLGLSINDFDGIAPTVIVGNPPFHASGSDQMANRFLRKALELLAPGGFLGMIMPAGFLKMRRQKCPDTRLQLLDTCELLEVWEMPERTVGLSAEQATCVIIARKRGRTLGSYPVVFKVGYSRQGESVRANRDQLRSTWTFAAEGLPGEPAVPWHEDTKYHNKYRLVASPINSIWCRIGLSHTIGALCHRQSGTGIDIGIKGTTSYERLEGYEPYLQNQYRLNPYFLQREDWHDDPKSRGRFIDPESAHRKKEPLWPLFRSLKVIVRCDTNRNSRMQIGAAFDAGNVFPEHHFRCLSVSKSSDLADWALTIVKSDQKRRVLLWLTAVINSPIGHAWVAMSSPPQGLLEDVLHGMPIPGQFDGRIADLVESTRNVERPTDFDSQPIWAMWSSRPPHRPGDDFRTLTGQINRLVFQGFGLTDDDFETVSKYLEGMTNPWVDGPSDAHLPKQPERRITGTVISVDAVSQTVELDIPRYSRKGAIRVSLPKDMPGWALRSGIEFTCLAPKDLRDASELVENPWLLRDFRPIPYSYLSADQLDKLVAQHPG